MLKSIQLKNFKSFVDTKDIELTPITLLSGQNSSGKSTLIQALLVLKQTLESPFSEEPLILNGAYVSLGEYYDILNSQADCGDSIEFGVKLKNTSAINKGPNEIDMFKYPLLMQNNIKEVSLNIEIDTQVINEEQRGNLLKLKRANISSVIDQEKFDLNIVRNINLIEKLNQNYDLDNNFKFDDIGMIFDIDKPRKFDPKPEAVKMNKFLPDIVFHPKNQKLIEIQDKFFEKFTMVLDKLIGVISDNNDFSKNGLKPYYMIRTVHAKYFKYRRKKESNEFDEAKIIAKDEILQLLENLISDYAEYHFKEIQSYMNSILSKLEIDELKEVKCFVDSYVSIINEARNARKTLALKLAKNLRLCNNNVPATFGDVNDYIVNAFNKIYYLGPLREEPKVFYRRSGSTDPMYVGQKGENVAFVLKYYNNRIITTILPGDNRYEPKNSIIEQKTLGIAVKEWLKYIGIANDVKVEEMGKIGLSLRANIYGDKDADLTNVGVGVSQVLPLIVMGLAAPIDSILIFEQPELHLHPYVQSRLADFFIAMSKLGKQIIAETHSEHLIHRMRYHIAARNINISEDINVYFAQRDNEAKKSDIIKVNIDKFGAIDSWPKGFFDETNKLLDDILNAALEREDIF
ncbi:MAG TPA: DUF3696 domain-containing protein [Clostridia bacterium]|nr:DUF3696 domain-containing protein [Clostridia bacterium]